MDIRNEGKEIFKGVINLKFLKLKKDMIFQREKIYRMLDGNNKNFVYFNLLIRNFRILKIKERE